MWRVLLNLVLGACLAFGQVTAPDTAVIGGAGPGVTQPDPPSIPLDITNAVQLPDGTEDEIYAQTLQVVGGSGVAQSCSVTAGALPAGITAGMNGANCEISGIPTVNGSFNFTITLTDTEGNIVVRTFDLDIAAAPGDPPEDLTAAPGLIVLPTRTEGANQVTNPGFESDFTGWVSFAQHSIDSVVFRSGAKSAKLAVPDTGTNNLSFDPGTTAIGLYTIRGWMKTDNVNGTGGQICFSGNSPFSEGNICSNRVTGTQDWTLVQATDIAIIAECAACRIKLGDTNATTGTIWLDDVEIVEQEAPPLQIFMKYPNYRSMLFDDQTDELILDAQLADDPVGYTIRLTLIDESDDSTVVTDDFAAADGEITFSVTGVANNGSYLLKSELLDDMLALVYEYPKYRVLRLAASVRTAMPVSYDYQNYFLFSGTRAFILGTYDHGNAFSGTESGYDTILTTNRRLFEASPAQNLHLEYGYYGVTYQNILPYFDLMATNNMFGMINGNCFGATWGVNPTTNMQLVEGVNRDTYLANTKDHAANAGYYMMDECRPNMVDDVFPYTQRLRDVNRDGFIFGASAFPKENVYWRDTLDVVGVDPYPLNGALGSPPYDLGTVADWTQDARNAVIDSRPIITVIQYFDWTNPAVFPTYDEIRNMSLMAIAKGANGLMYWSIGNGTGALANTCSGWCQTKIDRWQDLKDVLNELAALETELTLNDDTDEVVDADGLTIRAKRSGDVVTLIVSNETGSPVTPTIELAQAIDTVEVNSGGSLTPTGATFSPTLAAYGGEIYTVTYALEPPLTNLVGWYKLDEGTGQVVADSSPSAADCTVGVDSNADTTDPAWATVSGHSVQTFDGSNDVDACGNPAALQVQTGDHTIFVLYNSDASGNSILTKGLARGNFVQRDADIFDNGTSINYLLSTGAVSALTVSKTDEPAHDGTWHVITVGWDGTTNANGGLLQIDNGTATTATATSAVITNLNSWNIAGGANATNQHDGQIAEVLIYSSLLDATNRTAVYDYLKAKYSGFNLP